MFYELMLFATYKIKCISTSDEQKDAKPTMGISSFFLVLFCYLVEVGGVAFYEMPCSFVRNHRQIYEKTE